jgi:hypothetical protein
MLYVVLLSVVLPCAFLQNDDVLSAVMQSVIQQSVIHLNVIQLNVTEHFKRTHILNKKGFSQQQLLFQDIG